MQTLQHRTDFVLAELDKFLAQRAPSRRSRTEALQAKADSCRQALQAAVAKRADMRAPGASATPTELKDQASVIKKCARAHKIAKQALAKSIQRDQEHALAVKQHQRWQERLRLKRSQLAAFFQRAISRAEGAR